MLVTGAGAGIGRAIATAFVQAGAQVMANGLHATITEEAAKLLRPVAEDRIATYIADVSSKSDIDAMVAETIRRFGQIDILVNNAAIFANTPVVEMSVDEWDALIKTYLRGPFLLCQAVACQMIERGEGGKIINITSSAHKSARRGASHYCSSKAALAMFTKVLALELAEHRINVNSVSPGLIEVERMQSPSNDFAKYLNALVKMIPLSRMGKPDEVARAVLFLASEDAEFINGEILEVDGGGGAGRYSLPLSRLN